MTNVLLLIIIDSKSILFFGTFHFTSQSDMRSYLVLSVGILSVFVSMYLLFTVNGFRENDYSHTHEATVRLPTSLCFAGDSLVRMTSFHWFELPQKIIHADMKLGTVDGITGYFLWRPLLEHHTKPLAMPCDVMVLDNCVHQNSERVFSLDAQVRKQEYIALVANYPNSTVFLYEPHAVFKKFASRTYNNVSMSEAVAMDVSVLLQLQRVIHSHTITASHSEDTSDGLHFNAKVLQLLVEATKEVIFKRSRTN